MKTKLTLLALALASGSVFAQSFVSTATVRSVTPQMERVPLTREICDTQMMQQTTQAPAEHGGAILGTVIGGVIGSRFGGGNGRLAATALGAGIGAVAGSRNDEPGGYTTQSVPVRTCRTETTFENQVRGYRVVYDYAGQEFATTMAQDPGRSIRVNVNVAPVNY